MKINSLNPLSILARDSLQLSKVSCLELTHIPCQSVCIFPIACIKSNASRHYLSLPIHLHFSSCLYKIQCIKTLFRHAARPVNEEHSLRNMNSFNHRRKQDETSEHKRERTRVQALQKARHFKILLNPRTDGSTPNLESDSQCRSQSSSKAEVSA